MNILLNKLYQQSRIAGLLFLTLFMVLIQSCEEEDDLKGGTPEVHYVRITNPESSDSLVVGAYMGSMIALVGDNLESVREIWFNDQKAFINTSFIANHSIIVSIPNEIPEEVTNELKLISHGGEEVIYPFTVLVPPPLLTAMESEFVSAGDTAVIKGNFFIDDPNVPLQVTFPGNIPGEVLSVSLNEVSVKVPEGAGIGPVSVKTLYGSSRSSFYFRDDRNIILDYDVLTTSGSWRGGTIRQDDNLL